MIPNLRSELDRCSEIADKLANPNGYICIAELAKAFNIDIIGRPLLVEGLIARPQKGNSSNHNQHNWKVLFDSERYGITTDHVRNESEEHPLSERLRFTLAHEIAHTLSFRADTFELKSPSKKKSVSKLETEANALAPILLVSNRFLDTCLSNAPDFGIRELISIREKLNISREVLVSKLESLQKHDPQGILNRNAAVGTIFGIGTWKGSTTAQLMGWPILSNFGNSSIPEFIFRIRDGKVCNLGEILPFMESIPEEQVWTFEKEYRCGTKMNPSMEQNTFQVQVEKVLPKKGNGFLFMIRNIESEP